MRSLALTPAGLTLFLATAAILLAGTALAARWLPWFRRGSPDLRADRLLLAVLCPLLASGAITLFVMATLVEDLLAFHQVPHLCLDPGALSTAGRFAVFALEGGTLLALVATGCQMARAIQLLRQYERAIDGQQLGLSDQAAAAVARVRERLECTAEFCEADLPRPTAFVLGARRPRCIIARSLVERLSPEELGAAIAHEAAHLHRGDHIAQLLIFTCGRLFGFLPPVRARSPPGKRRPNWPPTISPSSAPAAAWSWPRRCWRRRDGPPSPGRRWRVDPRRSSPGAWSGFWRPRPQCPPPPGSAISRC